MKINDLQIDSNKKNTLARRVIFAFQGFGGARLDEGTPTPGGLGVVNGSREHRGIFFILFFLFFFSIHLLLSFFFGTDNVKNLTRISLILELFVYFCFVRALLNDLSLLHTCILSFPRIYFGVILFSMRLIFNKLSIILKSSIPVGGLYDFLVDVKRNTSRNIIFSDIMYCVLYSYMVKMFCTGDVLNVFFGVFGGFWGSRRGCQKKGFRWPFQAESGFKVSFFTRIFEKLYQKGGSKWVFRSKKGV